MVEHLLVPLDGSAMAEAALPVAAAIARRVRATVTLVHVIERNAPAAVHRERHLVDAEEAGAYLRAIAAGPLLAGLPVDTHVHTAEVRDVARSITQHTEELAPDLVVMTTHGTGGARRLFTGAIAQQVVGLGQTPVLLVRPGTAVGAAAWTTVLAPVDGDPGHEKGIPAAAALARAFGCRLHLLMVTPTPGELEGSDAATGTLLPGATRMKLEMDDAAAREYLRGRAAALAAEGLECTCEASRGDPARAIVKTARRMAVDLVVMGTHGRAGSTAFWKGSVAARVIARLRAPLLLVPLR